MNPTPVAYIDSNNNLRMGQPRYEGPLYSEAQLRQARADALRDAADVLDEQIHDVTDPVAWLHRMAAELEEQK